MTYLNPLRHYLNLTVRGEVFVRKIVVEDRKAVGVEAESGGKVFCIEADRVVLKRRGYQIAAVTDAVRHWPRRPFAAIRDIHGS